MPVITLEEQQRKPAFVKSFECVVNSFLVTFRSNFYCFRAKRLAYDFNSDQGYDDDFVKGADGLGSTSFYGTPRTPSGTVRPGQWRRSGDSGRPGDIVSPRPQLLADSVSSSRCLLSPMSRNKDMGSSQHISSYRALTTPSRKRKEVDTIEDSSAQTTSMPTSSTSELPSPYSYRGLENLTNSCYMNATLQALASVFPFYYRMQMIQQIYEEGYDCSEFVKRFNDVLQNLVSPDRVLDSKYGSATKISVLEALRTAAGKELGSDPDFGSNVQQDAHEFLAKTLEILEKEALRLRKFNRSISGSKTSSPTSCSSSPRSMGRNPAGVFQHKIRDRYGCERCARASEMTNDAIDLTVTVRAGESIQKMIEHALAREEIEYKCDICGPGSGFISRAFATLPQSLIIVVKRYRFGEAGGSKVDERVGVSRELFLKDLYVDSEVKRQEGKARQR
ncbi:ubiquitinyl hydrolase 1 [Cooperia oncophora]